MNLIDDFSNLDFKPGNKKKKKTRKKRSIIENNNTVRDINDLNPLLDNPPIILKFNESKKSFDFTIDYTTKQWEDENNDERKIQSELKEIDDKEKEKDIVKFPCLKQRKKSLPINILTLGLFTFVINASLILFASWAIDGFSVTSFWSALFFSIVLSLLSYFMHKLFGTKK